MDHLHRVARSVIALVLGCLLGGFAVLAMADEYPGVPRFYVQNRGQLSSVQATACGMQQATYISGVAAFAAAAECGRATLEAAYGARYCSWRWGSGSVEVDWAFVVGSGGELQVRQVLTAGQNCGTQGSWVGGGVFQRSTHCPYGGTLSGGQCIGAPSCPAGEARDETGQCVVPQCTGGLVWNGTTCAVPDCNAQNPGWVFNAITGRCSPPCTDMAASSITLGSGAGGQAYCRWWQGWSYCQVTTSEVGFVVPGGVRYVVTPTGAFCDGETQPDQGDPPTSDPNPEGDGRPPQADPEPIPNDEAACVLRGQTWGYVNGVGVCVPRGTPGAKPTSSQGSSTTTEGESESTTTITTQTNADGSITVTTQTGEQVKVQTGSRDVICAQSPTLPVCSATASGSGGKGEGDESAWGGSCLAGFTCSGDAVQCAIAREQHIRNCELHKETDESALYASALSGNDPGLDALNPDNRETVELGDVIDDAGFLAASCVEDLQVSVMGSPFTVPFSVLCPYLELMGAVVVAFSMIAAARIVFV